ncbi:MAG TPA: hypothetical protein VM621_10365 [Luteibacter sp.]|uniref:hypothetical protein n=1 Tax=Luteibacter sp. TaxID=1886636 RepID=UPI002CEBAE12|nr:hypothetical protein [Luteibacter sp.]HVI55443.1 hypothetical protein [Luteibacter sp.]
MTKLNGWTGGAWRLFHSDDGHAWIADKNLNNVCWVRIEENARLIAAAPDLYEALADAPDIMAMQPEEFYIAYTAWLSKARAALSAAEGGV